MQRTIRAKIFRLVMTALLGFAMWTALPSTALAVGEVCEIIETGQQYNNLTDALAAVQSGQTIKLLDDINHSIGIVVTGQIITFDVNGHTLSVTPATTGHALEVGAGGEVRLADSVGGGAFNVKSSGSSRHGVYAHDGGKAEVTNASTSTINNTREVFASGAGTTVTVYGNATGGFYGLEVEAGASVTVRGYVSGGGGMLVRGSGTTVNVGKYVNCGGIGVIANDNAHVYIGGNVYSGMVGVSAKGGSQITIDGFLQPDDPPRTYIEFDSINKEYPDYEPTSSKPGYFEYNDTVSYVWVKRLYPPLDIDIAYIYEGTTAYVDQNATGTAAAMLTAGIYDATLVTAPDPEPTRAGYTFVGWFTEPDGTGTAWLFGSAASGTVLSAENGVDITDRSLTLYANWIGDVPTPTYTVTYLPGLSGTFAPQVTSGLAYGDATPAPPTPTGQPGWGFNGWYPTPTETVTGDATYTALWMGPPAPMPTFTVTFAPGAHGTFAPQVTGGLEPGADTPKPPKPTGDAGWVFTGWSPTPEPTVHDNAVYVAQWKKADTLPVTGDAMLLPSLILLALAATGGILTLGIRSSRRKALGLR